MSERSEKPDDHFVVGEVYRYEPPEEVIGSTFIPVTVIVLSRSSRSSQNFFVLTETGIVKDQRLLRGLRRRIA